MKKSKVLIPAMALLLFSTAASITGTVAWFTSSRIFETAVGDFTVRELDGNLKCTMTGDVGTTENTNKDAVSVNEYSYLIDASLNASTSTSAAPSVYRIVNANGVYKVFADNNARDTGANNIPTGKVVEVTDIDSTETGNQTAWYKKTDSVSDPWEEVQFNPGDTFKSYEHGSDSGKWLYRHIGSDYYYLAVSWTMKFDYVFNQETAPLDIFLDTGKSVFTGAAALSGNYTQDTAKGFRIAFLNATSGDALVWGNRAKDTTVSSPATGYEDIRYVTGTKGENEAEYTDANYVVSDSFDASTIAEDVAHTDPRKVCSITRGQDGTGTTTILCVAWFEGTDPEVVSDKSASQLTKFQTLGAKMSFFGRSGLAS